VNNQTIDHGHTQSSHISTTSPEAEVLSRDLKQRGFTFCGPTVCYAFMQGAGLINDHLTSCFRYSAVQQLKLSQK
jgi:DNA-3-methyladenine glycosylase I